jgi:isovaleryl-CoA dehydrogenase
MTYLDNAYNAAARACEVGKTRRFDLAGTNLLVSENAAKTTLEAIRALGAVGYNKDAELYDFGGGTNEIRRFVIGWELIGA